MRPKILCDAVLGEGNFRLGLGVLERIAASKRRRLLRESAPRLGRVLVPAVRAKAAAALQVELAHGHGVEQDRPTFEPPR